MDNTQQFENLYYSLSIILLSIELLLMIHYSRLFFAYLHNRKTHEGFNTASQDNFPLLSF
jgi:hypothetical protein